MIVDSKQGKSGKDYAFVRDGSRRIFLRNILFVRHSNNRNQIAIVKEWGAPDRKGWEPPKGQMEWKEFAERGYRRGQSLTTEQMIVMMRSGVLRELQEEAKLLPNDIQNLTILPLSYTEAFPGSTDCFRYQFWEATCKTLAPAQKRIRDLVTHPDWVAMIQPDAKEKDAVEWWSPSPASWSKIRGDFSKKMVELWVQHSL
jgi:8-oxo-dGTP pyrophosphatase MutT (NUDIX family)